MAMMALDFSSPAPLYQQLQDILRSEIVRKTWTVGGKLPSEHELCAKFGVTRPTVRQALEGLVREGLLRKHRGKGAFVTEPPAPISLLNSPGTAEAFADQKLRIETQVLSVERVPNCVLSGGEDPPGGWLKIERVRRIAGIPTFYEYTWIHAALAQGLERTDLTNRSLFRTLGEQFGLRVDGGHQRFSAVSAPLNVAVALAVKAGAPLLRLSRSMNLVPAIGGDRVKNALQVDLFVAPGPFVLEQPIPAQPPGMPQMPSMPHMQAVKPNEQWAPGAKP
jgi:GntR family transcriptional regulator